MKYSLDAPVFPMHGYGSKGRAIASQIKRMLSEGQYAPGDEIQIKIKMRVPKRFLGEYRRLLKAEVMKALGGAGGMPAPYDILLHLLISSDFPGFLFLTLAFAAPREGGADNKRAKVLAYLRRLLNKLRR